MAHIAAMNQILHIYSKERNMMKRKKKKMRQGRLQKIINEVKEQNNLPNDLCINVKTIWERICGEKEMLYRMGAASPLEPVDEKMVATMIRLAQIYHPVRHSVAIYLVNTMIEGTPVQDALIEFKKNTNTKQDPKLWGTVGRKFWYNLKARCNTVLMTKKGQKFELDRSTWTTYSNFEQM